VVLRKFARAAWPGNIRELRNVVERALLLSFDDALEEQGARTSSAPPAPAVAADPDRKFKEAKDALVSAFEKDYVSSLLERTGRNVSKAARDAGIDRKHFERLMRKHGITR
jgi:DNA-binding NtrC family response regulator